VVVSRDVARANFGAFVRRTLRAAHDRGLTDDAIARVTGVGDSTFHRWDGRWHVWVTVGTKPNGRPDQRHIKRKTQDLAEEAADELLDELRPDRVTKAGRKPTVQEWLTTYLDTIAPRRCNPGTVYDYRSKMRNWVYPDYGAKRIDRFSAGGPGRDLPQAMDRCGKAPSHQLKVHRILSRALDIAERRGLVGRNVARAR
jgi:hypothetical protein